MMTRRMLGLIVLTIGCLFFIADGLYTKQSVLRSFDFKPVYGGARCLLDHCNPYDIGQIEHEYLSHGGDTEDLRPFTPYNAVYPPSALVFITPFAMLPWPTAHWLWLAVSVSVLVLAAFLVADLCAPYSPFWAVSVAGLLMATSAILLMLAQPAMLTIGFCVIAVWCLLKDRFPVLAVVCFALSLTLKPHIGGPIWLYFLLSGSVRYRKQAWQIFFVTILLCLPGVIWASLSPQTAHWIRDIHVNLTNLATHGNTNDPGPANEGVRWIASFQAVIAFFRDDPRIYNPVTWLLTGIPLLIWLYVTVRMKPSRKKDLLGLASIVCLSFLPMYHRQYDTRLLLLALPALALLLSEGGIAGTIGLVLSSAVIVVLSVPFTKFLDVHYLSHHPPHALIARLIFFRSTPLAILVLGLFYLMVYVSAFRKAPVQRLSSEYLDQPRERLAGAA